jgi:hypothetical protein
VRLLVLTYFLLINSLFIFSQNNNSYSYPLFFENSFTSQKTYINPAYIDTDQKLFLTSAYNGRMGALNDVANMNFSAGIHIQKNKNVHALKCFILNEKEGPYISNPSFRASYGLSIPLAEKTRLSIATSLGTKSIIYTAPSGSMNANAVDGNIGMYLLLKQFEFGISSEQMFNAQTQALSGYIINKRYYHFFVQHSKDLNPYWSLKSNLFIIIRDGYDSKSISSALEYQDFLSGGVTYRYQKGMSYFLNFKFKYEDKSLLNIAFNYNSSQPNAQVITNNSYEISVLIAKLK